MITLLGKRELVALLFFGFRLVYFFLGLFELSFGVIGRLVSLVGWCHW